MTGDTDERTKELELCLLLAKDGELQRLQVEAGADFGVLPMPERVERYNRYYTARIGAIDDFVARHGPLRMAWKLRVDTYFEVCLLAMTRASNNVQAAAGVNGGKFNAIIGHRDIWNNLFRASPAYRHYLERYILVRGSFFGSTGGFSEEDEESVGELQGEYYYALSQLDIVPVRDWYITQRALMHIPDSSPEDIRRFLDDFGKICRNERYLALLESKYAAVAGLYDAVAAPEFTLKDDKGNSVSLSDFRGRIVYLDFWDPYCGPCIAQFQQFDRPFHEKYADADIVHIYICFSDDEARWKQSIEQYGLQGVNLITESRRDNPLYEQYAFYGFPHYVLIGRDGRIVKNGCERPSELLGDDNSLSRLLQAE